VVSCSEAALSTAVLPLCRTHFHINFKTPYYYDHDNNNNNNNKTNSAGKTVALRILPLYDTNGELAQRIRQRET